MDSCAAHGAAPVAIYHLKVKSFGRSAGRNGSRATSAAAYRAGERIRDERTGSVYDHRHRQDVLHKEILLPARAAADERFEWARQRASLWNAAELTERPANARVAREYTVSLPHELSSAQRLDLARAFARDVAERYGAAVDLVLHAPRRDARAYHAHLLTTTREVTPQGLGPKTVSELSDTARVQRGLPRARQELRALRERWADLTNGALRSAGLSVRVSSLTSQAQGQQRARPWIPAIAWQIEQRGGRSYVAERIRAQFALRQERARLSEGVRSAEAAIAAPQPGQELEKIRAEARRRWLALRNDAATEQPRALTNAEHRAAARDQDLSL